MPLEDPPGTERDRPAPSQSLPAKRQVNDVQTMRALSHPVRIAILETLSVEGPMTATEVGERIGESPTTCSFHLRQLAKYGFVEEAGGGKGRARPWRMNTLSIAIRGHGDPEAELAADVLAGMFVERQRDRYRTWQDTKAAYRREWREAAGESEYVIYLTAAELKQLRDEVSELIYPRFAERFTDPSRRPQGAAPVEMVMFSYPLSPPPASPSASTAPTDNPRSAS
ncbi:MAG TPA: helix-turn-helix domain-containing protein [Streptosporangiaceae bacterium]|nr:helix-turn-helix domain-containing protein [Streptosporangiaceae bacterium]